MTAVYFHSPSGEAALRGSERAHLGAVCRNIAVAIADLDSGSCARRLSELVHPNHYMAKRSPGNSAFTVDPDWQRDMQMAMSGFSEPLFSWRGKPMPSFSILLNTALVVGNDAVRLATRIHGQCEIHGYVEGQNREWLADIMQGGLDSGIFRKGLWYEPAPGAERKWSSQGWEDVITLLRTRDDEPVAMSYSVCDSFPSKKVGDWLPPWPEGVPHTWDALTDEQQREHEERQEAWYDLSAEDQWRISLEGLRAGGHGGEMKPDNWATFHYRHGLSFLDLLAHDHAERLDAADLDSATEEAWW